MQIIKQNVGVEVDSKLLQLSVQVMNQDLSIKIISKRQFSNTPKGFKSMQVWLDKKCSSDLVIHLTMEATGVYYESVAYYFLALDNYSVHVVLPNTSNAFIKSLNNKSKTDEIDSRALAQMGLERQLSLWNPHTPQMRLLKKTNRERLRLNREKTMITNQLHAEQASYKPTKSAIKRYQKRIKFIEKQIAEIEAELLAIVQADSDLNKRIDNVCTAKGIGFTTAVGVVAELNGFALFKNRNQVVSFSGYDVKKHESGTSIRGRERISKKGNSFVRQMLYFPAISAAVHAEHHRKYYQRIVDKTGIKMKGSVAIQRKLLLLIYTLFKNNVPYDPKHYLVYREKQQPQLAKQKM